MGVNGVTEAKTNSYISTSTSKSGMNVSQGETSNLDTSGVVYEPSAKATDSSDKGIKDYSSIVSQMKSELAIKNQQMQKYVTELLGGQATKFVSLSDIFKNLEVDQKTREEAQKEISDDGYWGVEKTSDRLVEMAKGLSGGDPAQADKMIEAIKKGFDQAGELWGDKLPEICEKTRDAAIEKLNKWRDGIATDEEK